MLLTSEKEQLEKLTGLLFLWDNDLLRTVVSAVFTVSSDPDEVVLSFETQKSVVAGTDI